MLRLKAIQPVFRLTRHISTRTEISEYFRAPQVFSSARTSGLFGIPQVNSPQGLNQFAQDSLEKAALMSHAVETGETPIEDAILRLDVLSDVICKVVDMAAFVRLAHPDPRMLQASQDAHEMMFEFMNYLNTSQGLYQKVSEVLSTPHIRDSLSHEEIRVGEILKHDFEKSGIQFSDDIRNDFVRASNVVSVLGQQFLTEIGPGVDSISFSSARELEGLNPLLVKKLSSFTGKVTIPLDSNLCELALQSVHNQDSREKIWRAQRTADPQQIDRLTSILTERHRVARISGYESFASYELSDKMMKTPENVSQFLASLMHKIKPRVLAEINSWAPSGHTLQPWDHSYYHSKYAATKRGHSNDTSRVLANYFALGNVLQGISDVCETLYNIRFVPGTVAAGEVWDPEIRRLDVYEGNKKIGVIYCDLFSREGKSPNPAHFTIQCSRQVWPWEEELYQSPILETEIDSDGNVTKHQIPMIVLVCDFKVHNSNCTLTFGEVQTLFHEMGHAVHSMIGRTKLHNVGGTRCATDFVELPSILMEKFASSPEVLKLFARDSKTGDALPIELFRKHQALASTTENWEVYYQIMLSLVDQALHGKVVGESGFRPGPVVNKVHNEFGLFPNVTSQKYAQFGHLVSYGATYYSYLLDRCLANLVWDKHFKKNPLSPEGGEAFKKSVLVWGGARDATECTNELVGEFNYSTLASHILDRP